MHNDSTLGPRYNLSHMPDSSPTTEGFEKAGFDVSLIDANLRLDPETRALRHQGALDLLIVLSELGKEIRGELENDTAAPARR